MPIGMGGGQTLGLKAKVEAAVDRSSQRQITKDVEQAIGEAEGVSPGGFQSRTGLGGGGGGGAAQAAGGAGLLSRFGGAGGAAATLGTVFLGGAIATGILKKMTAASGYLKASSSILGKAQTLFFKPFGDALGQTILPFAKKGLEMAVAFNKIASENGLEVAVKSMPEILAGEDEKFVFEGDLQIAEFAWDTYVDNLGWKTFVPSISWTSFIDDIAWSGFVAGVELANFVAGTDLDAHVVATDLREHVTSVDIGKLWNDMGGWPDVTGLWPGWPDLLGKWNTMGGWPSIGQFWNDMGGWPDIGLPEDFWPSLGSGSIISEVFPSGMTINDVLNFLTGGSDDDDDDDGGGGGGGPPGGGPPGEDPRDDRPPKPDPKNPYGRWVWSPHTRAWRWEQDVPEGLAANQGATSGTSTTATTSPTGDNISITLQTSKRRLGETNRDELNMLLDRITTQ